MLQNFLYWKTMSDLFKKQTSQQPEQKEQYIVKSAMSDMYKSWSNRVLEDMDKLDGDWRETNKDLVRFMLCELPELEKYRLFFEKTIFSNTENFASKPTNDKNNDIFCYFAVITVITMKKQNEPFENAVQLINTWMDSKNKGG